MQKNIFTYLLITIFLLINGTLLAIVWKELSIFPIPKKNIKVTLKIDENTSKGASSLVKYGIYFTSDDGPLRGSEYLNEIILKHKIPVTLFLVGQRVHSEADVSPKIMAYRENKHVLIANHSFSHANSRYKKFYYNSENVVNDFLKNEYFLNIDSQVGRLPGRNIWATDKLSYGKGNALESAKILAEQFSYKIYGWDYEIRHNKKAKVLNSARKSYVRIKSLLKNEKTYVKNNIVILMHDQMFRVKQSRHFFEKLIGLFKNDKECELKFMNEYPGS